MKKITPKALLVSWILAVATIMWAVWSSNDSWHLVENLVSESYWVWHVYTQAMNSSEWFNDYITDIWIAENYDWIIEFMRKEWWVEITDKELAKPFLLEAKKELENKKTVSTEYLSILWWLIVALWVWRYYYWKKKNKK